MSSNTFKIEGMTCQNCARHVREALLSVEGVKEADVSLDTQSATIIFNGEITPPNLLGKAVEKAGYRLKNL